MHGTRWIARVLGAALLVGVATSAATQGLLLDNFDRGTKPNALGGDFGAWNVDPQDRTQGTRDSFNQANAYGGKGYCLRLDYDVDSPNPAYNGFWSKLQRVDLTPYRTLSLYVKGDPVRGYTPRVRLELKNDTEVGHFLLEGITENWQHVQIPLTAFGIADWSRMTEFVIVFDDLTTQPKTGTLYVDEVGFE